ncbi:MAG: hypothetical protein HC764_17250 [Pleurocapsa sp. CRU_1_2]|nr:hypothetical protein [Pleurocapsa sp. CRU_1_2]
MSMSEQDIRAIVRDEIRRLVGVSPEQDIEYLPTNKAFQKLGFASSAQLREAVRNGTLRLGNEVQDRRSLGKAYSNYYLISQPVLNV